MEKNWSPAESLQMISEVIGKTKENIRSHSFPFLLWGWLIAIASILFFYLHSYTSFSLYYLPFPVLAITGIVLTINYYGRKLSVYETYLSYYLKKLWLGLGVGFILVVTINVIGGNPPFTYTMLMGGIGTLVSGMVLRFRPLTIGGILLLLFSLLSAFVAESFSPLIQAIAVVLGYLIPGYLLKFSKNN